MLKAPFSSHNELETGFLHRIVLPKQLPSFQAIYILSRRIRLGERGMYGAFSANAFYCRSFSFNVHQYMDAISLSPSPYIQESVHMAVIISAIRRELYTQPVYHVKRMKKP